MDSIGRLDARDEMTFAIGVRGAVWAEGKDMKKMLRALRKRAMEGKGMPSEQAEFIKKFGKGL